MKAIIFDGDDTLWHTQPLFDEAISRYKQLLRGFGFDPDATYAYATGINVELARKNGMAPSNFRESLLTAYYHACKRDHVQPHLTARTLIEAIGNYPYEQVPQPIAYAREVLQELQRGNQYRLYLLTAGEDSIQRQKAIKTGMASFFRDIQVVERKDVATYKYMIDLWHLDPRFTWMVGNSVRSDINPATTVGFIAVHFDNGTWAYDDEEVAHPAHVKRVGELRQLLSIF